MQNRAVALCEALGLVNSTLDVDRLTPRTDLGEGVHNVAMAFRGPSNLATIALTQELTELAGRGDVDRTAARWLLAPPAASGETGTGASALASPTAPVSGTCPS